MEYGSYCIFSAHYVPHIGGIEKYTDNLARELASRGNRTVIVTNALNDDAGREKISSDLEVFRMPCIPIFSGRLPLPKKNALFRRLWEELSAIQFDGLLINARFYPHTFLGLNLASKQGLVPIVVDHGSAYLTFGNKVLDPFVAAYEKTVTHFVKKSGARFYAVSTKGINWLNNFGIKGRGVLSNSIDARSYRASASDRDYRDEFNIEPDALLISYTGRLIPEKGIVQLMEVARILKCENANAVFLLAGDGPLRERAELMNPGNVVFLGKTSPEDIAALMIQSDLLCMLTRSEGFSTSLLEASACGTPALITDVGGVDELIPDSSYGTILPNDSARMAVDELKRFLVDRTLLENQGNKVRERTEKLFSWQKTADDVLAAFRAASVGD